MPTTQSPTRHDRHDEPTRFSILGGPLHHLGRRLRLVHEGMNTVRLGLALGIGLWTVIAILSVVQGVSDRLFTWSVVGVHARLLLVIPLFFVCESWVTPRMRAFVRSLVESGTVRTEDAPALHIEVARIRRWRDSWWPEAACLLLVLLLAVTGGKLQSYGETAAYDPARTSVAARLYFHVGLTLFQFLLFRWLYHFALWCVFLWRVSRFDLRLHAGHPDGAGGLGGLEEVHLRFLPFVVALSVLESASLAEDIVTGGSTLSAAYPWLALVLLVDATLFLGPLFVFTRQLWASRTKGLDEYMDLAGRYVSEFERKWLGPTTASSGEPLLGTADLQSLADLASSVSIVTTMRWSPASPRLVTQLALAAAVPFLPLLLFKYPLAELAQKFVSRIVGL